ncbi:MAG TPA: N-methyl-L-tryptophan oxidase [Candidatus Dormibacteraeota bacterium]
MAPQRIAVIGCGAMGAAAGWRLAARGAHVVCFDRHSPPHAFGSTHGESRITRTAYFEGPWYVPLVQETFPLWRELEAVSGVELLTLTGALMIGPPSAKAVSGALAAAADLGLEVRLLRADEIRKAYPGHIVGNQDVAVLDAQAGFLRPEAAVAAMIGRVEALGGEIRRGVVVSAVKTHPDGVEIVTAEAREKFDAVVIAAGPWMHELVDWLPLTVERQVMAWFAIDQKVDTALTAGQFPVFIRQSHDTGDVYGFPTLDGVSLKIARHHEGDATDPQHVQRDVSDKEIDPLRRYVRTRLHGVTQRVVRTVTCMYTNTPDGHFAIGLHPEDSRIVVLSACSGHGFKFAPVIGAIAADLVCDGETTRDISHFAVTRFA